jgi:UDP-2,4-diacetamido-2,4,6-trideoxy-beta-L-altropyranose hydrolase
MARFLFRCDVAPEVGLGHFSRCLTLATALHKGQNDIFFSCRVKDFCFEQKLRAITAHCFVFPWNCSPEEDAELLIDLCKKHHIRNLIVDHYRLNEDYQRKLKESDLHWLQFDFQVKQTFYADWVHNANPEASENVYGKLAQTGHTRFLLGPAYALLREEFLQNRGNYTFRHKVQRILISFGGGEDDGATEFTLEALKGIDKNIERLALIGPANPNINRIRKWTENNPEINTRILVGPDNIAGLMINSDLAVIAGGTTTFEAVAMGLPLVIIQLADNQERNAAAWHKIGAAVNAGLLKNIDQSSFYSLVNGLICNPDLRRTLADKGRSRVDCLGAERVANILMNGK